MPFYKPEYLDIVNESELLSIIQESQFNNPYIDKIESTIGKIRSKGNSTTINADPLMLEIAGYFEKAFGFNSFQLTVEQSMFPNAYTYPLSSNVDMYNYKKMVKKTNNGLEFGASAKVNVAAYITQSLLFDNTFSDAEITAILLHEIGHNFSDSINKTLGLFSNVKKILLIPSLINPANVFNITNIGKKAKTKYIDYMRKNHKSLLSAFNCLTSFVGYIDYISLSASKLISTLNPVMGIYVALQNLQSVVMRPIDFAFNILFGRFSKEDEYTSDSFAAMYGYGPELATALTKLSHHNSTPVDEIFKSGEISQTYYALTVEFAEYLTSLLTNTHPTESKRILNLLDTLEQEYNKPYINPKFKKETKKEIQEIRALIKEESKSNSFTGNYWRIVWNRYIYSTKESGSRKKMVDDILTKIENLELKDKE